MMGHTDMVIEIGIVTLVFLAFSLVWLVAASLVLRRQARALRARDEREMRVTEITSRYLAAWRKERDDHLEELMKAGVWSLESDHEIRELCERAEKYTGASPFGRFLDDITRIGPYHFFFRAMQEETDFSRPDSAQDLIQRLL